MRWKLLGLVLVLLRVSEVAAERWTPVLKFSVEDSGYEKSLIFISGLSYGLAYSARYLAEKGGKNFYCLPSGPIPDSELIIDLLNHRLSGPQSAEVVTSTALAALREEFPCR
jgi:hypothetical protein